MSLLESKSDFGSDERHGGLQKVFRDVIMLLYAMYFFDHGFDMACKPGDRLVQHRFPSMFVGNCDADHNRGMDRDLTSI